MTILDFVILFFLIILTFLIFYFLNKINETVNAKLFNVQGKFSQHLVDSQGAINIVSKDLAELKDATRNILDIGKNIQSLQDILKPPKLRGALGEVFLEQALAQVLPLKAYERNYRFKTGNVVDAVVRLRDSKLLSIDAKFPLDSIKDYLLKQSGQSSNSDSDNFPGQFIRDVKKHVDDISNKYILQEEGTLDFAFMYIPAENVYYEIILKDEKIVQYAKEKHVIPVSPISLYSYLSTILIGLKGMEIEKNAKGILSQISNLKIDLDKLTEEYSTLGNHLNNAKARYDSSSKIISVVQEKLKNIDGSGI